MLDRARSAHRAVPDKTGSLFVPFRIGVIERVLQHRGYAVIVFGGHEDIAVEPGDFLLPALGDLILRRCPSIRRYLVKERHWEIAQIDDFGLHIVTPGGNILDPLRRLVTEAGSAGRADNDRDLEFAHDSLYLLGYE